MSAPGADDYLTVKQLAVRIKRTERWVLDHVQPSCPNQLPHHRFAANRPPVFSLRSDVPEIDRMFAVVPAAAPAPDPFGGLDPNLAARSRKALAGARAA